MVQASRNGPVSLNPFRTTKQQTLSARKRHSPLSGISPHRCLQSSQMHTTHSLFRRLFFVPRNGVVGNASLFQVVAGGSGGAMRQSGVTWWPHPYARRRAEVNKGFTPAKSQANLQVSRVPQKLNRRASCRVRGSRQALICPNVFAVAEIPLPGLSPANVVFMPQGCV